MRLDLFFLRIFDTKNLLAITVFLMLLYIVRELRNSDFSNFFYNMQLYASPKVNIGHVPLTTVVFGLPDYFVPTNLTKIDWHDYDQIAAELSRYGPGEHGAGVNVSEQDSQIESELFNANGFNAAASDMIPLNRSLPDIRHYLCKNKHYIVSLPSVSVVIPFYDEHFSTLLRTVYSVLNRSPEHLIKEVLLVDDASTKPFLHTPLVEYLSSANLYKVRIVKRYKNHRRGLISARLAGAKEATGDVIVFLDSHSEANVNWLPPLLEPIALNHRTVVCPLIDVVSQDTFEYRPQDEGGRGIFDWEFMYKRLPMMPKDEQNMPEPFDSPVMAGGLFAISRAFFWELGGYDSGLLIWGGEQFEISFKIWQCGGRMVDAPCSRVGHVYRKFSPFPNPGVGDFLLRNFKRVAEVWMDEYAEYLYRRRPQCRRIDAGDLTAQHAVRERLRCKPFRWFMTQIAFDLTQTFPINEPLNHIGQGRIIPDSMSDHCVNSANEELLTLTPCEMDLEFYHQQFLMTWRREIKVKHMDMCWDLSSPMYGAVIKLVPCHAQGGNQLWMYRVDDKKIWHVSGHCLDYDDGSLALHVAFCDPDSETQRWTIDVFDEKASENWPTAVERITGPQENWTEVFE